MKNFVRFNLVLALMMSFAAHAGQMTVPVTFTETADKLVPVSNFTNQIKLIFVIDNSGSMQTYQRAISDALSSFNLIGFNWKAAIVTTDIANTSYFTVESADSNSLHKLKQAIGNVGTGGSGDEQLFAPLEKFAKVHPEFFGQDYVAIILATDIDENLDNVNTQKDPVAAAKMLASLAGNIGLYGLIGSQDLGCQPENQNFQFKGSRYETFFSAFHNSVYPLCAGTTDMQKNVTAISTDIISTASDIAARTPVPVGGPTGYVLVLPAPLVDMAHATVWDVSTGLVITGWTYNSARNAIVLPNLNFAAGRDLSQVQIRVSYQTPYKP
ncbi:hypothetical protein K2X30_10730 [bacterium]|nr:hypothetical protein [bacterium]